MILIKTTHEYFSPAPLPKRRKTVVVSTEFDSFYKMSTPDELIIENFPETNKKGGFPYEGMK